MALLRWSSACAFGGVCGLLVCGLLGCGVASDQGKGNPDEERSERETARDASATFRVELGVPDVDDTSAFVALEEEGDVLIQDGGQGSTHALVALRVRGLGQWVFYEVRIAELEGGSEIKTPPLVSPRPTLCDEALLECRLSPLLVVIDRLADASVWDGLHVELSARVWNEAGDEAASTKRVYLRR